VDNWAERVRQGDVLAISRALSAIENRSSDADAMLQALFPHTGRAFCIGVTGAPGTGKSTLVDRLAAHYRGQRKTVGIIAVDPSSPFSGGAILGDRVRMQGHASDAGIFIRSMATRGYLGGLAQGTADAVLVLDAAGKEIIFIETVGVGQAEVEIAKIANCTLVVLMPGMGDDIQNLKAGLMEISDIFVLNKVDREDAPRFEQQLKSILQLVPERDGWRPPVALTVATENKGISELAQDIAAFREHIERAPDRPARQLAYWKGWMLRLLQTRLTERVIGSSRGAGGSLSAAEFDRLAEKVAARKLDPFAAVDQILAAAGLDAQEQPH